MLTTRPLRRWLPAISALIVFCPSAALAQFMVPNPPGEPEDGQAADAGAPAQPPPEATPPPSEPEAQPVAATPPAEEVVEGDVAPPASEPVPEGDWWERMDDEEDPLRIDHDPFSLRLFGLLQVWAVPWEGDDARRSEGAAVDRPGFLVRRARFGVRGNVFRHTSYELSWDFYDSRLDQGTISGGRLYEAQIGYDRLDFLRFHAGVTRIAFSRDELTPSAGLQLMDLPYAQLDWRGTGSPLRNLVPPRSVGFWVDADFEKLGYSVGLFNATGAPSTGPDAGGLLASARVDLHPFGRLGPWQGARFPGQDGYDRLLLGVGLGGYFWDDPAGPQLAGTADVALAWRGASLSGAFFYGRFSPSTRAFEASSGVLGDVTMMALHVQAGYFVLPGHLELAARYEWWDPATESDDASDQMAISGVASWYFLRHRVKAQLQFTHRIEQHATSQPDNDQLLLGLSLRI